MRRNVMLLQGPVGPFFSRFAEELEQRGFNVYKVNFNGGDALFYRRRGAIDFTGRPREWEAWLERLLINREIGRIYLFGDCRAHHRVARRVAERLGIRVFVFEEGYIRPNFITLEENGVNGFSSLVNRAFATTDEAGTVADSCTSKTSGSRCSEPLAAARQTRRPAAGGQVQLLQPRRDAPLQPQPRPRSQTPAGEPDGAAGSTLPGTPSATAGRTGSACKLSDQLPGEVAEPSRIFLVTALYAIAYYLASRRRRRRYPAYQHHRPLTPVAEGYHWILSGLRKLRYRLRDRHMLAELLPQFDGNYFVCPLQVHCDMQVVEHSKYNSIEHFIGDVLMSFAQHAPGNKAIVFKHHPMDRAYTDYAMLFANLVSELGLQGRVFYVHDVCLPTLLKHAQGTVLINSTVGMSSLFHGTPVKTLGTSIYGGVGLASQLPLAAFWRVNKVVDREAFLRFRRHLIATNQVNGNFYRRLSGTGPSGLQWPRLLSDDHRFDADRQTDRMPPQLRVVGGQGDPANHPAIDDDAAAA